MASLVQGPAQTYYDSLEHLSKLSLTVLPGRCSFKLKIFSVSVREKGISFSEPGDKGHAKNGGWGGW